MGDLIKVDDSNFDTEVLGCDLPVLVDFGAPAWCRPCVIQLPIMEKFAEQHAEIKVCKVDIDDSPALATKFKIRGVPSMMLFKGGAALLTKVGLTPLLEIESLVSTALAK